MQIRVYYEDTDLGGVVYHSNYLNFCERARSDAFFQIGKKPILETGHFVAKKLTANYISSAKLGDLLNVKTSLIQIKSASFILKQIVYKEDIKMFEMDITLAYIDFNAKPQKIDRETNQLIKNIYNGN